MYRLCSIFFFSFFLLNLAQMALSDNDEESECRHPIHFFEWTEVWKKYNYFNSKYERGRLK